MNHFYSCNTVVLIFIAGRRDEGARPGGGDELRDGQVPPRAEGQGEGGAAAAATRGEKRNRAGLRGTGKVKIVLILYNWFDLIVNKMLDIMLQIFILPTLENKI